MKMLIYGGLVALGLCGGAFAYWKLHGPVGPKPDVPTTNPIVTDSSHLRLALAGHSGPVRGVAFSPDGRTLASASEDQTVRLWDLTSRHQTQLLKIEGGPLTAVDFSPDGATIAVGRYDGKEATTIFLDSFEANQIGATRKSLKDTFNLVSAIAFSRDGKLLLGSVGSTVDLWDLGTGTLKLKLDAGPNSSSAMSPDGKKILTGSTNEKELKCWSAETGVLLQNWVGHDAGPASIQFSTDGRLAASAGYDTKMILWDTATGMPIRTMPLPEQGDSVAALRFSRDGLRVYGALLHEIVVWNAATGAVEERIPFDGGHSLAVSVDGVWLAAGGDEGKLLLVGLSR